MFCKEIWSLIRFRTGSSSNQSFFFQFCSLEVWWFYSQFSSKIFWTLNFKNKNIQIFCVTTVQKFSSKEKCWVQPTFYTIPNPKYTILCSICFIEKHLLAIKPSVIVASNDIGVKKNPWKMVWIIPDFCVETGILVRVCIWGFLLPAKVGRITRWSVDTSLDGCFCNWFCKFIEAIIILCLFVCLLWFCTKRLWWCSIGSSWINQCASNGKHIDSTGASVVSIKEKLEVWTIVCGCWEFQERMYTSFCMVWSEDVHE